MNGSDKTQFKREFIKKEYRQICGPGFRYRNILIGIISFTLLSLILSFHFYYDLREQMNDPYVNYLSLTVNDRLHEHIAEIKSIGYDTEISQQYGLLNVYEFHRIWLDFQDTDSPDKFKWMIGLSMDQKQPLYQEIKSNTCTNTTSISQCGIILSSKLKEVISLEAEKVLVSTSITSFENNRIIPLSVECIADKLPFKSDFIVSSELGMSIENNGTYNPSVVGNHFELLVEIFRDEYDLGLETMLKDYFDTVEWHIDNFSTVVEGKSYQAMISDVVKISGEPISYADFNTLLDTLRISLPEFYKIKLNPTSDFCDPGLAFNTIPDQLAFHFESLDSLAVFVSYMESKYQARFDLESVEMKKRMNKISQLTFTAIMSLMILATIVIFIFLGQLILRHIERSVHTLGMLKAFGLQENRLHSLYDKVILKVLLEGLLISLLIVAIISAIFRVIFSLELLILIVVFTLLVIISGILSNRLLLRPLLSRTPSDLINARITNKFK